MKSMTGCGRSYILLPWYCGKPLISCWGAIWLCAYRTHECCL